MITLHGDRRRREERLRRAVWKVHFRKVQVRGEGRGERREGSEREASAWTEEATNGDYVCPNNLRPTFTKAESRKQDEDGENTLLSCKIVSKIRPVSKQ